MKKYRANVPNENNINATRGCPCDECPDRVGCQTECSGYTRWVHYGAAKLERKARYHEKVGVS